MNIENAFNKKLGIRAGRLAALSKKPNCVSTQAEDAGKRVSPISYQGDVSEQMAKIVSALSVMPGASLKQQTERYAYVVFTSKLLRFKDDVEVYLDDEQKLVQFRSASRVGYSDLGVNRKRYDAFIARLR